MDWDSLTDQERDEVLTMIAPFGWEDLAPTTQEEWIADFEIRRSLREEAPCQHRWRFLRQVNRHYRPVSMADLMSSDEQGDRLYDVYHCEICLDYTAVQESSEPIDGAELVYHWRQMGSIP